MYSYYFEKKQNNPNNIIAKFAQIVSGYPFDSSTYTNGKYKIITIKAIQFNNFDTTTANQISEKPNDLNEVCELQIGDVLISLTGKTGRMAIVDEQNTLLNQRVGKLVCKEGFSVFSYCLFHSAHMQEIVANNSVGTSQKNVSPSILNQTNVYMPSNIELKKFNDIAVPIFNCLTNELLRIKSLLRHKNAILPLLMNGQAVVK